MMRKLTWETGLECNSGEVLKGKHTFTVSSDYVEGHGLILKRSVNEL